MPTVIDSLVVELGLDPRQFDKGQRDVVDRAKRTVTEIEANARRVEYSAQQSSYTFQALRNQVVGALAAFTGVRSVTEFGRQLATTDAAAARTSRSFGLSTRELQVWQAVAKSAGGSAEGITGTITGLVNQFQQFALTGESSVIPYFRTMGVQVTDANGKWRQLKDVLYDIAAWGEKQADKGQAGAIMRGAGIDNDTIALLLKGTDAFKNYLDQAERSVNVTKDSADSAERLVGAWGKMATAAEALGRSLGVFNSISRFFERSATVMNDLSKGKVWDENSLLGQIFRSKPGTVDWGKWSGRTLLYDDPKVTAQATADAGSALQRRPDGTYVDPKAAEAFIRSEASRQGITPDEAMRVARSEGFNNFQSTVVKNGAREKSYGAFQLYTGGGLGNAFQQSTGLDPSDPKNEAATIRFALAYAKQNGWGSWYGARNSGMTNWQGIPMPGSTGGGGSPTTNTTNIGTLTVVTQATNAAGIAADIKPALQRQNLADQANSGLN